ncbi:serine hydrolase domain-containing protein [Sphingomonas lycopersici]|uniref:Beta-lactamase family protein n=1 Tax=Sphingomonas lycopersici TaxID=2951807 RepID=A0AA42CNZ6_9SPHN|nr:serine hydrolase domain-containing protein [Sphingomonas lycopersici]MCW6533177.1 beta-lactamase family protein [Sphingomonas lycopersici]
MRAFAYVTSALAALTVAMPAMAAPDPATFKAEVDAFMAKELQAQKVPGAAVAVLRDGAIVIAKGYGLANIEHDVPVTPDTIFQSGSLGKMFTATAVMLAVQQGKIGLDDPVSKYLPGTPPGWSPITVRQLLTHTSGIPNYGQDFDYRRDYSEDELLKIAYALPLSFKPGARWSYSNTAYEVLGILVHKATGRTYVDILDKDVFAPLGMKTARGISDADIVPHRAAGYHLVDGALKNQDWVSPTMNSTADGSLYFSLNDMIAWARGVEQQKLLGADGWRQVYTPVRLNSGKTYHYGFGWQVQQAAGKPHYSHGGAWQGFKTYYSRYLGDGLSIVVLSNSAETKVDELADGIAGLWDPALTAPPPRPAPAPAIAKRVTALIEKVRTEKLTDADLPLEAPGFAAIANQYFSKMLRDAGPLTRLDLIEKSEEGDDVNYVFNASFGQQQHRVAYKVAPGDQAASFYVAP